MPGWADIVTKEWGYDRAATRRSMDNIELKWQMDERFMSQMAAFTDRLKGLGLSLALGVPLLYAAHAFMAAAGRLWWVWLWAFLAAVQVVLLWLYPAVIAPLFNRFTPLPDGELRARLEALCRDTGFRTRGLFVMDASRRSAHSNAYLTGIFRPRIVLFDTLVERMSPEESAAVLAHEVGHFKLRHVQRRLALGLATSLAGLFVLSLLVDWRPLFEAFGFERPSLHAAVALFALAGPSFTFFLEPLGAWLSRRHEFAADRYSAELTREPGALAAALVKLNGENLANLDPHPWYARWHHSHPTLLDQGVIAFDDRRRGAQPPFGTRLAVDCLRDARRSPNHHVRRSPGYGIRAEGEAASKASPARPAPEHRSRAGRRRAPVVVIG